MPPTPVLPDSGRLTVAAAAVATGLSPSAIRFYDDAGVVAASGRTDAGYRLYDHAALERLRFAAHSRGLGLSLAETAMLLRARDGGSAHRFGCNSPESCGSGFGTPIGGPRNSKTSQSVSRRSRGHSRRPASGQARARTAVRA